MVKNHVVIKAVIRSLKLTITRSQALISPITRLKFGNGSQFVHINLWLDIKERTTDRCGLWTGDVIGLFFFEDDRGHAVIVNGERYRDNFLWKNLKRKELMMINCGFNRTEPPVTRPERLCCVRNSTTVWTCLVL